MEPQAMGLNQQNEVVASFIMQEHGITISDYVVDFLQKKKTFNQIFKEVNKIVNKFTKNDKMRSGCTEIVAVMILNSNFYSALYALDVDAQESKSKIILLGD